jgi:hypothetical protein
MILVVIGFMLIHNILDYKRKKRWKKQMAEEKKYIRMTGNERIQHFFLLTSFIVLVITGFWLKFPEAWWVKWIVF